MSNYRKLLVLLYRSQKKRLGENGGADIAAPFLFAAIACVQTLTMSLIAEGITRRPLFVGRSGFGIGGILIAMFVVHYGVLRSEIRRETEGAQEAASRLRPWMFDLYALLSFVVLGITGSLVHMVR